jgi:ribonuclease HII
LKTNKTALSAFDIAFNLPVCGIDEVGRGPLAGPVVAACAFIPADKIGHPVWKSVDDSKSLSAQRRDDIFDIILSQCHFFVGAANVDEIDNLNIHHATLLAMMRAYDGLKSSLPSQHIALIDGKFIPAITAPVKQAVVKGDSKSLAIAAASIIAKVTRDRMMQKLHAQYPVYGWDQNAGYGTPAHMAALRAHGVTPHHRLSFAPCRMLKRVA